MELIDEAFRIKTSGSRKESRAFVHEVTHPNLPHPARASTRYGALIEAKTRLIEVLEDALQRLKQDVADAQAPEDSAKLSTSLHFGETELYDIDERYSDELARLKPIEEIELPPSPPKAKTRGRHKKKE